MIGTLRKFSTSIYAKIFLGIVIIPFIFWGMGGSIVGGSKNIVVVIDKQKYSTQEFINFAQMMGRANDKMNSDEVEDLLSVFISEKLIEQEVNNIGFILSDKSLGKLIKNQDNFKRENNFSRVEYEKFLLKNNIPATIFEDNLSSQEKKKQLLNFIGGGLQPSEFLINYTYNKINQKRNIELLNLNNVFKKKINISNDQIKIYFENNKDKYIDTFNSVKLLELSPKRLIDIDEFNNLFFEKIDEIDDLLVQGRELDFILKKYNLGKADLFTFDKSEKEINSKSIEGLPKGLIKSILILSAEDPTNLIEKENKYFIVEKFKTENIQKNFEDENVRKDILLNLERTNRRKLVAELIGKINENQFTKSDFDKLSKNENVAIQKINLQNSSDNKIINDEIVNQIYSHPEKAIIVVNDVFFSKNFLIYIDKIQNVNIDINSEEYQKYLNLTKLEITNQLYKTYDKLIKERYEIDINYQTLNTVKDYFN